MKQKLVYKTRTLYAFESLTTIDNYYVVQKSSHNILFKFII